MQTSQFPLIDRDLSFAVTSDGQGHWVAREARGLICGVFRNQKDAIRFALHECGGLGFAVLLPDSRVVPVRPH